MPDLPSGTVTLLFTDIEGSTRLLQRFAEHYDAALADHHAIIRGAIASHGGVEVSAEGDAFFVAFARASDAVAAAVAAQRALAAHPWSWDGAVRVRMGLHTGQPRLAGRAYAGLDVHRAARIAAAAHGGQVLISDTTAALVRQDLPDGVQLWDMGKHWLKDLEQPERLHQLAVWGLPAEFPAVRSLSARPNNLPPQRERLIGREAELDEIIARLRRDDVGLLTLTGAGGSGKTRLAIAAGVELLADFADGVFFVDLAPISEPEIVASAIAQAVGVKEAAGTPLPEELKRELQTKHLLLILDNFEQVTTAAALVADLLNTAPRLTVLATSRVPLHLREEQQFPVSPLALPTAGNRSAEQLSQFASVELFIQRALAVKPDFSVTNDSAPAVAEICCRLDGLPLAIELAAARVRLLSPQALLTRLERRLPLLMGGARDLPQRHQTLRDTIAWSYGLLTRAQQAVYRRVSLFAGSFPLAAVEYVCDLDGNPSVDALEGIGALVENSLLRGVDAVEHEARFAMLQTIREFGLEQLVASGEDEVVRRRHAAYFLAMAERAAPELIAHGPAAQRWLANLEAEHDNLREALRGSIDRRDADMATRLCAAIAWYWYFHAHLGEGMRWVREVMTPDIAGRAEGPVRTRMYLSASVLAHEFGDHHQATAWADESLSLSRESGDSREIATAANSLAVALVDGGGDLTQAESLFKEAAALYRVNGEIARQALALGNLGWLAWVRGDGVRAAEEFQEALRIHRDLGDTRLTGRAVAYLGFLALDADDPKGAAQHLRESLPLLLQAGDRIFVAVVLGELASAALAEGRLARAARLCGASETLRRATGGGRPPKEEGRFQRTVAAARDAVRDVTFSEAWALGAAMPIEEAVQYALNASHARM